GPPGHRPPERTRPRSRASLRQDRQTDARRTPWAGRCPEKSEPFSCTGIRSNLAQARMPVPPETKRRSSSGESRTDAAGRDAFERRQGEQVAVSGLHIAGLGFGGLSVAEQQLLLRRLRIVELLADAVDEALGRLEPFLGIRQALRSLLEVVEGRLGFHDHQIAHLVVNGVGAMAVLGDS